MSTVLPFSSNTLTTYVYEPFSYTISNPGSYTLTISNSPGILPGYLTNNGSNVVFSTTSNAMSGGTQEYFIITAKDGSNVVGTSSNTVNIKVGRFLDADPPGGVSYEGSNYTFYKNEPITGLPFVAPFEIAAPTSQPTLPPGLTFVSNASNAYTMSGTPLVTAPQSNYTIIGKATGSNTGKIVTSKIGISISNERVRLTLTGSSIVSPMTVGTPISARVITAQFPPYTGGGDLRYTWSGLPDGISVIDISGNSRGSPFTPSDPAYTLIFLGTPTITAANAYRNAGISSNTVTFTATRTNPLPVISNTVPITFGFGETVLFDTPSVPIFYSGVALDPSATFFRAQTYFGSGSSIAAIFSPDLRSDLSINFVPPDRGYLKSNPSNVGPGATGTATYTIRAINTNAISRDLAVPITVATDTVTFVSPTPNPVDTCFNFVLSRPSSLSLSGYYTSSIQFKAISSSGNAVTFTSSGLSGTGLSLSNVGSNTVQLVGTPDTVTPLTTATITANVSGTPATASTTFKFQVLNDVITLSNISASSLSFIQNRSITPIQFSANALSERPVISFTSTTIPSGLTLSPTGLLSGRPLVDTSGSFTINASTGYATGSKSYSYTLIPDSILFLLDRISSRYSPGANVVIDIDAVSYSGFTVSNYQFLDFTPSYGLSIDSASGVISGTLSTGVPPADLLPVSCNFYVKATAGTLNASLPARLTTVNPPVAIRNFILWNQPATPSSVLYYNDNNTLNNWSNLLYFNSGTLMTDFQKKNTTTDSNAFILCANTTVYLFDTTGLTYTFVPFQTFNVLPGGIIEIASNIAYTTRYSPDASCWYAAGIGGSGTGDPRYTGVLVFKSVDDGSNWSIAIPSPTSDRIVPRDSSTSNYYTSNAVAFASNSGVMLLGGGPESNGINVVRSTNEGSDWSVVVNGMYETSTFNTDGNPWIMAGSSHYSFAENTGSGTYTVVANSLRWSDDMGVNWSNATGSTPDIGAYEVAYASNQWLATGMGIDTSTKISTRFVYSTDGKDWSNITLPETFTQFSNTLHLPELGPIWLDGSNWKVFVNIQDVSGVQCRIYKHSVNSSLTSNWLLDVNGVVPFNGASFNPTLSSFVSTYVEPPPPYKVTLSFNSTPSGGPTVLSPTQTSFVVYQYASITPIVFTATGTGQIYYFVDNATLPRGIMFNPLTATLSGTSVVLGETSFTVYVKDDVGVTTVRVSMTTVIATVVRQQSGAGAWTSLVRQYTIVNAAQNSVNGHALPATEPPLGEFMRPEPPDSVSAAGNPNCINAICSTNSMTETGGGETNVDEGDAGDDIPFNDPWVYVRQEYVNGVDSSGGYVYYWVNSNDELYFSNDAPVVAVEYELRGGVSALRNGVLIIVQGLFEPDDDGTDDGGIDENDPWNYVRWVYANGFSTEDGYDYYWANSNNELYLVNGNPVVAVDYVENDEYSAYRNGVLVVVQGIFQPE